jgi:hypothetical protein
MELEKFKIKSDYSFIQEQLIENLEKILEKASMSHTQLRSRVENIEMDMYKIQA